MTDYHSGWKRGKGARRIPWRDGGARPWPRPTWRKQALHAVAKRSELRAPVELTYESKAGKLDGVIYRLDQAAAKARFHYFILGGQGGWGFLGWRIQILVAGDRKDAAQRALDALRPAKQRYSL